MPIINMSDESTKKRPTTRQGRKDRTRAKKKSHKLTERHVQMIRSQKGKMSCREIAKWFGRQTHYVYKVSHVTVSMILNGKIHSQDTGPDIYDMILAAQAEEVTEDVLEVFGVDAENDLVDE